MHGSPTIKADNRDSLIVSARQFLSDSELWSKENNLHSAPGKQPLCKSDSEQNVFRRRSSLTPLQVAAVGKGHVPLSGKRVTCKTRLTGSNASFSVFSDDDVLESLPSEPARKHRPVKSDSSVDHSDCTSTNRKADLDNCRPLDSSFSSNQSTVVDIDQSTLDSVLCSAEPPAVYWKLIAEERRKALDSALRENQLLVSTLDKLEDDNRHLKLTLASMDVDRVKALEEENVLLREVKEQADFYSEYFAQLIGDGEVED